KPLYLSSSTSAPSLGPPLGVNVWYRYVYVKLDTGGYSEPSEWTSSPISAGNTTLPCKSPNCNGVNTGKNTCQANLIQLSIDTLDYSLLKGDVYANVHRYVAPLSTTT